MNKFILMILILTAMTLVACELEEEPKKVAETKEETKEEVDNVIRVDKQININNVEMEIQTVTVEGDTITIPVWWSHKSSYDKAHLTLLVNPVVEQDSEELEVVSGADSLLKQIDKGKPGRVELQYKLRDSEAQVDIRLIEMTDALKEAVISVELGAE